MESHSLNPGWRTEFRIQDYVHEQGFSNINQNPDDGLRTQIKSSCDSTDIFSGDHVALFIVIYRSAYNLPKRPVKLGVISLGKR